VTPLQDIPIHAPVVLVPGTGLCCGLGGPVDTVGVTGLVWELGDTARILCNVPDIAGLEIGRGSRENCRR
jgi:hypothetical protein